MTSKLRAKAAKSAVLEAYNAMKGKRRTPLHRSSARKRKTVSKPVSPRPKGETERLAVRRLAAMKYRIAGASYRSIAAKLTEDRANAYADANGIDGARERPVGSGVLEGAVAVREWPRASWPTGSRDDGTALPDRCRYASRSEPVSRYAAHASYAGSLSGVRLSQGRWVSVIRRALLLGTHDLQILSDGPAFGGGAGRVSARPCGRFSSCRPA